MTDRTVTTLERRTKPGRAASLVFDLPGTADLEGWFAEVECGYATLECSKLDGETGWVIDALWRSNGVPVFSNGFGARYLGLKFPAAEIVELLEDELGKVTA